MLENTVRRAIRPQQSSSSRCLYAGCCCCCCCCRPIQRWRPSPMVTWSNAVHYANSSISKFVQLICTTERCINQPARRGGPPAGLDPPTSPSKTGFDRTRRSPANEIDAIGANIARRTLSVRSRTAPTRRSEGWHGRPDRLCCPNRHGQGLNGRTALAIVKN